MLIRFTSSMTAEDENRLAPALLKALSSILDLLPIAYAIRIETSDSQVYQHRSSSDEATVSGLANLRGEVSGTFESGEERPAAVLNALTDWLESTDEAPSRVPILL